MRLSQLEIKGFKSFADETVINFNEQIIGVVGPNGSGKSNIVDAIKWVLGEQKTKELRLESMSDVIFAGTKNRKAGKIARVTVNFDNTKNVLPTEYNSVSISRLLYSNGQSEYRLNDVQCRKKDITSLFLDSGLGSNAYAIISLSMVEDILVDRENSRGRMIEEASGINKFKVRKRETLNKLKGTQADLDRVEDLLFELETNLKSFEKQARRTERYLKVKEEFKLSSLSWATRNGQKLKTEIRELQTKWNDEKQRESEVSSILNTKEAALQKVKKEVLEKEGQLSDFQRTHNKLKDQISALESKKGIAQNELTFLNESLRNAQVESESLQAEIDGYNKNLEAKRNIKNDQSGVLKNQKSDYDQKLLSFNAIKEVYDSIRHNLVSGQQEKDELRKKIEKSKREISVKQSQIALLQEQLTHKTEEEKDILSQLSQMKSELEVLDKAFSKKENSYNNAVEKRSELQESLDANQNEVKELETVMRQTELKRDRSVQRAELLENVINNYEGFTEAVQYLNSQNKIDKQLLSDVLEISDQQYQEIVELFFSPLLQHIIVDTSEEAFELNEIVRGSQKGKVNFFINESLLKKAPSNLSKNFKPLLQFLDFDKKYEKIITTISKNAYLFDGSFEELLRENIGDDVTILLPKELLIFNKNELRGGSATLFEGVNIGRRKNLEKLQSQIISLQASLDKNAVKLEELKEKSSKLSSEIIDSKSTLDETSQSLKLAESEKNTLATKLSLKENSADETRDKNKRAKDHIESVKSELDALVKLSETFSDKTLEEDNIEQMKADFDQYHKQFEGARTSKDEIHELIMKNENALSLTQRDIDQLVRNTSEKTTRLGEIKNNKEKNEKRIEELLQGLNDIKENVVKLYADEKEQYQKLNSQEEAFYTTKSGIYDQEKEIFELRGKRDKLTHLITALKDKLTDHKAKRTSWKDRIEVEFNENIDKYEVPEDYLEIDLDSLGIQRENLQVRLKSFGDINPLAIEAYNEIKLRVEKITTERDDILNAKLNLEETIKDIEQTASDLFTESLDKIRVHFKEVFRSLFSDDDDCDIVLLNADNPLDSSIEIVAKPKGKKPKSINQLSGGEKTLTAVSFLFALYLLKPAPFCIFDEVDAPLDDVNIQKFNKIIRKFSKESQFIIVTHNKSTMAEMDILYGVFMQETGVSGVAAVDFREFEKIDVFSKN